MSKLHVWDPAGYCKDCGWHRNALHKGQPCLTETDKLIADNAALRARLALADKLAEAVCNYSAKETPPLWQTPWACIDEALAAYRASAGGGS